LQLSICHLLLINFNTATIKFGFPCVGKSHIKSIIILLEIIAGQVIKIITSCCSTCGDHVAYHLDKYYYDHKIGTITIILI